LYQQHVWRCDGPCQSRKPFFGFVRRSRNSAPGQRDFWWAEHQKTCGGTYKKIQEPEEYTKKKQKEAEKKEKNNNKKSKTHFFVKIEKLNFSFCYSQQCRRHQKICHHIRRNCWCQYFKGGSQQASKICHGRWLTKWPSSGLRQLR
jgi:hypothetical protein